MNDTVIIISAATTAAVTLLAAVAAAVVSIINAVRMTALAATVQKVETNTNSMSERLERSSGLAGEAKGRSDMRAEQEATAQSEAKGRAEGGAATITADQIVTEKIITAGDGLLPVDKR